MGWWDTLVEPLSFPFMQRALVGCLLVGLICAVLGVFVVLQNMAFIGQGLAYGSLPGLAIGFAVGASLYLSTLGWAVLLALAIAYLRESGRLTTDTAIAIAFSLSAAIGVALIALVRFGPVDVSSFLFGNVLAIGITDLWILLAAAIGLGTLLLGLLQPFAFVAFDPEAAAAAGVPVRALNYLFLVMVAVAIVVSLQTVGLILVTALLVMPAAAAQQWVARLDSLLILAAGLGALGGIIGLYASYHLDLPSGATIVLTVGLLFLASLGSRAILDRRGRVERDR